jgi:hypothetical protein
LGTIIAKYAVFNDVAAYNTWYAGLGMPQGDNRFSEHNVSLVDPVNDLRVTVKIDTSIDETNLTVWDYKTAMTNGFADPKPYIAQQIQASQAFGASLIIEVGAENVAIGLTREQIADMSADMFSIQLAAQSGSLILKIPVIAILWISGISFKNDLKKIITKNSLPGSKLIQWGLNEPASHFAVVFDNKLVLHSSFRGVHLRWYPHFINEYNVVDLIELNWSLAKEEKIYQAMLNCSEGQGYDWKAFSYFFWRGLLKKFFKVPIPDTSPFKDGKDFLCTEIAYKLPRELVGGLDLGITSPYRLFSIIKERIENGES